MDTESIQAIAGPSNVNIGRPVTVYDGWAEEKDSKVMYSGKFHGFSQDVMRLNNEYKQITVAIVEQDDGLVEIIPIQRIKFQLSH